MNKAMKRRQKRKERDMRWVRSGRRTVLTGSHRHKKIFGEAEQVGKGTAFWCSTTDAQPLISRLYHELAPEDGILPVLPPVMNKSSEVHER